MVEQRPQRSAHLGGLTGPQAAPCRWVQALQVPQRALPLAQLANGTASGWAAAAAGAPMRLGWGAGQRCLPQEGQPGRAAA